MQAPSRPSLRSSSRTARAAFEQIRPGSGAGQALGRIMALRRSFGAARLRLESPVAARRIPPCFTGPSGPVSLGSGLVEVARAGLEHARGEELVVVHAAG